jgi:hypothetical protein
LRENCTQLDGRQARGVVQWKASRPFMPIDYQRDDQRRLIVVILIDPVSFDDLTGATDRQWADGAWDYAILYDSTGTSTVRPPDEIQRLIDHTRSVGGARPRGPVGVAIPPRPDLLRQGLELADRGGPMRDIEILLNETQVNSWLVRHAVRRGVTRHQPVQD